MQRPFLLSTLICIPLIIVGVLIMVIGPSPSNKLPSDFKTPVIAFEFATKTEHVNQIFPESDLSAQTEMVQKMTNSTRLDFLFLVLYGAFLFTFSITCTSLTGNRLYYLVALLSIVAPLFDVLENLQMLSIMEMLGDRDFTSQLRNLHFYTWVKWSALALIFLLLIPFFRTAGTFGRFLSIFAIVPSILAILASFKPGLVNETFAISTVLMFLLMIIFTFVYRKNA